MIDKNSVEWTRAGDLLEHGGKQWLLLASNIHVLPSGRVMRVETAMPTNTGGYPLATRIEIQPTTFVTVFHGK